MICCDYILRRQWIVRKDPCQYFADSLDMLVVIWVGINKAVVTHPYPFFSFHIELRKKIEWEDHVTVTVFSHKTGSK